jgi:hypothetical protein
MPRQLFGGGLSLTGKSNIELGLLILTPFSANCASNFTILAFNFASNLTALTSNSVLVLVNSSILVSKIPFDKSASLSLSLNSRTRLSLRTAADKYLGIDLILLPWLA